MNRLIACILFSLLLLETGCGPVKTSAANQYTLTLSPQLKKHRAHMPYALLISKPDAMAGYRTNQMLYVKERFKLEPFAKNAWSDPPADMLYPLLVERFQDSHAFRAITSSPYADKADYRLDTQLVELNQNFLTKQSTVHLIAKVTLTRVSDNRVLASRLLTQRIPCTANTPYSGVVAANQAAGIFAEKALDFVIRQIQSDKSSHKT